MAESPREILRRIRGIKSTQQITKAMEMVSAVKLAKVRARAENSRPYVQNMETIMRALCSSAGEISHPFFVGREDARKVLLVVITSDRGLCGTFNANIISAAKEFVAANRDLEISTVTIGRKGTDALPKLGIAVERSFDVPWGDAIASDTKEVNHHLVESFETQRVDRVHLLYSRFENVLKYTPTLVQHLPVAPLAEEEKAALLKLSPDFLVEPSFDEMADRLVPQYLETQLYHALVESLASEYAARMVSMRNANDNAEEVIEELTLSYNKARQASITRDLIDIIGGVEALNG